MQDRLPPHQFALLKALAEGLDDPSVERLATAAGLDQSHISGAATELEAAGIVTIEEQPYTEIRLGESGWAISRGETELPERLLARALRDRGGSATIKELCTDATSAISRAVPKVLRTYTQVQAELASLTSNIPLELKAAFTKQHAEFASHALKYPEFSTAVARFKAELAPFVASFPSAATLITKLQQESDQIEAEAQAGKLAKGLVDLGWAVFEKGALTLSAEAAADEPPASDIEAAMTAVAVNGGLLLVDERTDPRVLAGAQRAKGRKELLSQRERSRRLVSLTRKGESYFLKDKVTSLLTVRYNVSNMKNELTPDMLADGSWRGVQFRPYDVTLAAERVTPGKPHPLARLIEEVRLAFLELGFSEANCRMAELAFWDFDALFQPQDHPAREMQDTFYCAQPSSYPLPDPALVERIRATHETGGDTGSLGWRYKWSPQRAAQVVLRTHMTASSIEAIARNPRPPQKVFSIGRVFRRETLDFKHLPEFTQVDGIIIDEHASFASLLGTMATFCARIGIPEVRFKPDFFPYTEPSAGVEAFVDGRWLELAGSGIFRPEVTLPFGCTAPVLAWGFGLERLAMARFGVTAIKDLYQADLDWLKAVPLES